jgi:hypothetical protein
MKSSIPRLHSVRFKDGRAPLRVIRPAETSSYRESFIGTAQEIVESHRNMSGYIVIAWSKNGRTATKCVTDGMPVPQAMLPDFAKTCIADWLTSNNK